MTYCYKCMRECGGESCPHCGYRYREEQIPTHHLLPGTVLNRRYMVGEALGEGGFGITYIGMDQKLGMKVAVKEFFPHGYANRYHAASATVMPAGAPTAAFFEKGKNGFLQEARMLGKFAGEKRIVDVIDCFAENGTAYIVMEYVEGVTLKELLKQRGVFSFSEICALLRPIMEVLGKVHAAGLIHRDVSPDNIMIMPDGSPMLMDFGSVRQYDANNPLTMSVMLKPGYAPEEQYRAKGVQGPWTDVYALCATIYRSITGIRPTDSLDRAYADTLKPPSQSGVPISPAQEAVLMKGLAVYKDDRFQTVRELIDALDAAGDDASAPERQTAPDDDVPTVFKPWEAVTTVKSDNPTGGNSLWTQTENSELPPPPPKKRSKKPLIIAIGAALLTCLTAGVIVLFFVLNSTVEVPRFVSLSLDEAKEKAEKIGIVLTVSDEKFDSNVNENYVISQSQAAGAKVKKGSEVTVIVSLGEETVKVPDVVEKEKDDAVGILEKADFKVTCKESYSDTVKKGKVISQSVKADTSVPIGTEIVLTVSKGEKEEEEKESSSDESSSSENSSDETDDSSSYESSQSEYFGPQSSYIQQSQTPGSGKSSGASEASGGGGESSGGGGGSDAPDEPQGGGYGDDAEVPAVYISDL